MLLMAKKRIFQPQMQNGKFIQENRIFEIFGSFANFGFGFEGAVCGVNTTVEILLKILKVFNLLQLASSLNCMSFFVIAVVFIWEVSNFLEAIFQFTFAT